MAFKKLTYKTEKDEVQLNTVEPIRLRRDIRRIYTFFDRMGWHKYSVVFLLGIHTGLRISDLLNLKVYEVRNQERVWIREKKTGKPRSFIIHPDIRGIINEYVKDKKDDAWVFEGTDGRHLDRSQVYRRMKDACAALKIDANVGTHTFRKTFGYHFYRQIQDIMKLQTIFNHTSPDVTKRYIGITQDEIDEACIRLKLLEDEDDLEKLITKGNSKTKIKKITSFLMNYKKNGGQEHLPIVDICLDILKNNS